MPTPNVPVQRALTVGLSLQETLWPQLDATASNLANSTTPGFKRVISEAKEVPYNISGGDSVSYVKVMNVRHDFNPGAMVETGNAFDLAISGEGFFLISGGKLTRNGQFTKSVDGKLITSNGETVQSNGGGDITIPNDAKYVQIASDGTITTDKGNIGSIGVVKVADTSTLHYTKDGYYLPMTDTLPVANPTVYQGYKEESNVNPMEETIKLIQIQRRFEQAQKLLDDEARRQQKVINVSARSSS